MQDFGLFNLYWDMDRDKRRNEYIEIRKRLIAGGVEYSVQVEGKERFKGTQWHHDKTSLQFIENAVQTQDPDFYREILKDKCTKLTESVMEDIHSDSKVLLNNLRKVEEELRDLGVEPENLIRPKHSSFAEEFVQNPYCKMDINERRERYIVMRDLFKGEGLEQRVILDINVLNQETIHSYYELVRHNLASAERAIAAADPSFYAQILKDKYVNLLESRHLRWEDRVSGRRQSDHNPLVTMEKIEEDLRKLKFTALGTLKRQDDTTYAEIFAHTRGLLQERRSVEEAVMATIHEAYKNWQLVNGQSREDRSLG